MDNNKQSIDTRERIRRSMDKIRVNNPFDKPYATLWDGFPHVVPAHGFAIMERYLAEKWLEEQAKRVITERADNAIKAENKRRITSNQLPMDRTRKTGEQYEFETPFYANWSETQRQVIKEFGLYGGIAQEYGMDYMPEMPKKNKELSTSIIDDLEKMTTTSMPSVVEPSIIDDLEGKDVFTLHKIAKEKGLETDKSDKKADLIRAITQS